MTQDNSQEHNEGFGFYKTEENEIENYLYNWVFHFNSFTGVWSAIPRDVYHEYWNNSDVNGVIRSKSVETLTEIIKKTKGNIKLIEKFVDGE
jgi:hypothetical protein